MKLSMIFDVLTSTVLTLRLGDFTEDTVVVT